MSPTSRDPLAWIEAKLAALKRRGLLRERSVRQGPQAATIDMGGRSLINFGSNDYLGLAADARLAAAARQVDAGFGSGASPLVTGFGQWHERLEKRLADFCGTEAALIFSSGYAANVGAISSLVGRGDCVFSDEKNHASIIDGCRLSRADVFVYRHGDAAHLQTLLASAPRSGKRLIVTDGLFSMDGDLAPLADLAELADRYAAMLLVDEAHATGVLGARGRGAAEHAGVGDRVDVHVGTLSKALGSCGGFVAGELPLIRWLVNRARSYVFSTAPPAATCIAALSALDIVRDEPQRRSELAARHTFLRHELSSRQGWNTGRSVSHIVPLIVGSAARAMEQAARLRERGFVVPGIRPPTVPSGESLLRISLTCSHTPEMIERLIKTLAELRSAV